MRATKFVGTSKRRRRLAELHETAFVLRHSFATHPIRRLSPVHTTAEEAAQGYPGAVPERSSRERTWRGDAALPEQALSIPTNAA